LPFVRVKPRSGVGEVSSPPTGAIVPVVTTRTGVVAPRRRMLKSDDMRAAATLPRGNIAGSVKNSTSRLREKKA
jgi:hypothetical protein